LDWWRLPPLWDTDTERDCSGEPNTEEKEGEEPKPLEPENPEELEPEEKTGALLPELEKPEEPPTE